MTNSIYRLHKHLNQLEKCQDCEDMFGPPVHGEANLSPVMLVGQAPGNKEIEVHKPFAWTAGKTLFKWFGSIGLTENEFRQRVYMSAVCRCFPGKNIKGGDRVPNKTEIANCDRWLDKELSILQPQLVIPVGKLAIAQFMHVQKLNGIIGHVYEAEIDEHVMDIIPLPHPYGASTWHRSEPGISLLEQALSLIKQHPAWRQIS